MFDYLRKNIKNDVNIIIYQNIFYSDKYSIKLVVLQKIFVAFINRDYKIK